LRISDLERQKILSGSKTPDMTPSSGPQSTAETFFAPAGRSSQSEISRLVDLAMGDPLVQTILEAVQGFVVIINAKRQILAANTELLQALSQDSCSSLQGLRLGEIMECSQVKNGPDGCGTAASCRKCGAVLAILAAQQQKKPVEDECRLSIEKEGKFEARDFRVRATPLHVAGEDLQIVVLQDISSAKRREILERVFVHDLLNTVGGIEGFANLRQITSVERETPELVTLAETLKYEIDFHHSLIKAEKGDLPVNNYSLEIADLLYDIQKIFRFHQVARKKELELSFHPENQVLFSDRLLLSKILMNMVKNAFEAIPAGKTVRLRFRLTGGLPTFEVWNPGVITPETAIHIFERSFSTKGVHGRGIGTYSMKLFGERFLRGKVSFVSNVEDGTIFTLRLPAETLEAAPTTPLSGVPSKTTDPFWVMVVEDEESIAELERLFLERLDCQVALFPEPLKALQAFTENPESFDLVLTDFSLPQMSGLELAQKLKALRSDIPILLCTGFSEPFTSEQAAEAGIRKVITKPFSSANLGKAIMEIRQIRKGR
jgi:hypothetical protein